MTGNVLSQYYYSGQCSRQIQYLTNSSHRNKLEPKTCDDKLGFSCEALKIDFDSKMLKRYKRIFQNFDITTGVIGTNSELDSGPLVDKTLYEGEFPEDKENVVFDGAGNAGATSSYNNM